VSDVREMQSGLMTNPFGEQPLPLWRRVWKRRDNSARAPKRYSMTAGGLGAIIGLAVSGIHGMDHWARGLFVAAVTTLPTLLVETWWKQRSRRRSERLMVSP
jgi:hypothetical protein